MRIQIDKLAIQIDSSQSRHRPNQMVMDMMKPKRPQKRKNSESMENLISLKRYHIDSSAGFPSTRWYDSCTDLIKLSGIATKTNSSSGLLTPETSPCHENEHHSKTPEESIYENQKPDLLMSYVGGEVENIQSKILEDLLQTEIGELFEYDLIKELISLAKYELAVTYLFVTSPSIFNSNEELCDNSMRITIKMLRSCRLELSELNQIFLLLVTSSVPDSWKSETNRSHLQRIQKVTNASIQKAMSNIDSTGLPRFVNVLRLLAQLKELTPKWSNSSQS